jgi:hypothetical protein
MEWVVQKETCVYAADGLADEWEGFVNKCVCIYICICIFIYIYEKVKLDPYLPIIYRIQFQWD